MGYIGSYIETEITKRSHTKTRIAISPNKTTMQDLVNSLHAIMIGRKLKIVF